MFPSAVCLIIKNKHPERRKKVMRNSVRASAYSSFWQDAPVISGSVILGTMLQDDDKEIETSARAKEKEIDKRVRPEATSRQSLRSPATKLTLLEIYLAEKNDKRSENLMSSNSRGF